MAGGNGGGGSGHGGGLGSYNQRNAGNAQALYNALAGIGAAWTDRGYGGYQNLSLDQINQALSIYGQYPGLKDGSAWAYLQNLQARKSALDQEAAYGEFLSGMAESMAKAAQAAAYVTPYAEVLKNAPGAAADARDETAQRQALRRGLMSTFSSTGGLGGGTDI